MADWFAELLIVSILASVFKGGVCGRVRGYLGTWVQEGTYLSTTATWPAMAAASSFSRCGLLPVFSSCSTVATTTSSFMPSVSTLVNSAWSSSPAGGGEGGGVCVATEGLCSFTGGDFCEDGFDGLENGSDGFASLCDRLTFLGGGW